MTGAMTDYPLVSVIIPVYNDAARLALCLNALESQRYPADRVEILVVDNGSTDDPAPAVGQMARARLLYEPTPGSYAARNLGIAAARGDVLAFTDADCLPKPDWLCHGVRLLDATPNCGLVGGRIRLFTGRRPTTVELYQQVFAFQQEHYVRTDRFAATANMFTTRAVMRAVGTFDQRLKSGGDHHWGNRVADAGYTLAYAPDAVVLHPARPSQAEWRHKLERVVGGVHAAGGRTLTPASFAPPVRALGKIARSPELHGPVARLRVMALAFLRTYIRTREALRLKWGGSPQR